MDRIHVVDSRKRPKIRLFGEKLWAFHCPGCGYDHLVAVNGAKNESGAGWAWNGSTELPTFTPSILVNARYALQRCHSFVTDGKIRFLADSFHELAGKTVELPDWED